MKALLRSIVFCIAVALTAMWCLKAPMIQVGNAAGVVMDFPAEVPGFVAKKGSPDPVELKMLPEDTQFEKATFFSDPPTDGYRDRIFGSIVLSGEERKSIHRPEVCLQGQGWTIVGSRELPIKIKGMKDFFIKDLSIEKNVTTSEGNSVKYRAHYMYWFVGQDVTTPSHVARILLTLKDNIFRNINHRWAYVSMMSVVNDTHDVNTVKLPRRSDEEMVAITLDLIRKVTPVIQAEFIKNKDQVHGD